VEFFSYILGDCDLPNKATTGKLIFMDAQYSNNITGTGQLLPVDVPLAPDDGRIAA